MAGQSETDNFRPIRVETWLMGVRIGRSAYFFALLNGFHWAKQLPTDAGCQSNSVSPKVNRHAFSSRGGNTPGSWGTSVLANSPLYSWACSWVMGSGCIAPDLEPLAAYSPGPLVLLKNSIGTQLNYWHLFRPFGTDCSI